MIFHLEHHIIFSVSKTERPLVLLYHRHIKSSCLSRSFLTAENISQQAEELDRNRTDLIEARTSHWLKTVKLRRAVSRDKLPDHTAGTLKAGKQPPLAKNTAEENKASFQWRQGEGIWGPFQLEDFLILGCHWVKTMRCPGINQLQGASFTAW